MPRQAKELGLCGYCDKRKIKYLASETYTVKKKRQPQNLTPKIRVKRKTVYARLFQHSAVEDVSAKSLKLTLLKLGIAYKTTDRKPMLFSRLEEYYKPIYPYIKYKNDINKIIHLYRRYARNSEKRMRGPGFTNPSLCVNDTDFYTCEHLAELESKYLFTYENNGIVYGFDIRSFKKLLDYTAEEIIR